MEIVLKYTICWIGLVIIAIVNGALREKVYGKFMDELTAHQLSTVIGIVLFSVYIMILSLTWKIESSGQALAIGGIWLALTVAFELFFGHYVIGHSWRRLFQDYNLLKGRLWILVLMWTAIAPYTFYKLQS